MPPAVPRRGTTGIVLRCRLEDEKDPDGDRVFYGGFEVATHLRILLQRARQLDGGPGHFGAALTIRFPRPLGYYDGARRSSPSPLSLAGPC